MPVESKQARGFQVKRVEADHAVTTRWPYIAEPFTPSNQGPASTAVMPTLPCIWLLTLIRPLTLIWPLALFCLVTPKVVLCSPSGSPRSSLNVLLVDHPICDRYYIQSHRAPGPATSKQPEAERSCDNCDNTRCGMHASRHPSRQCTVAGSGNSCPACKHCDWPMGLSHLWPTMPDLTPVLRTNLLHKANSFICVLPTLQLHCCSTHPCRHPLPPHCQPWPSA